MTRSNINPRLFIIALPVVGLIYGLVRKLRSRRISAATPANYRQDVLNHAIRETKARTAFTNAIQSRLNNLDEVQQLLLDALREIQLERFRLQSMIRPFFQPTGRPNPTGTTTLDGALSNWSLHKGTTNPATGPIDEIHRRLLDMGPDALADLDRRLREQYGK